jgi:serine/threonine protein kinase
MDTMPGNDPMEKQAPLAGLDPAELLKQGAAEDTFMEGAPASFNPPPIDELAKIFPQFEILELIGQGGMGAVYKVRQKDLDRIVALKILPPAIGQSPEFSERFTREARALAKLNHPGIVTLHEFGQQDGLYFILMEFVDGVNLAQLMKTGCVSPREALAIVPQICDALQYAHDQGIVHRDIKPENLLLDRQGRVKVADFGIAKVVAAVCDPIRSDYTSVPTDATLAGKIIGTPQYMAPEQIEHPSDVDHRADIYALGVVFYQMLTGELPDKDLQAPSRKVQIDVRLDEIVLKAMEKNPEMRYQQASVLRTRVDDLGLMESASPALQPAAGNAKKRSTGKMIALGCGLLLLVGVALLVILLMSYWFLFSNREAREGTVAQPIFLRPVKTSEIPTEKKLATYDWKNHAANGRIGDGVMQTLDGRSVLKIENFKDAPMQTRLLTIESPAISATKYALSGEIRYEDVQGKGYMEMWSIFPDGRYFTRTLGVPGSGSMSQLAGTSSWREFTLPFDRTGTKNAPSRIEVNLFLPRRGVVFVGPLKLIEYGPVNTETYGDGAITEKISVDALAEAWLAGIDAGDYARSWNEAAEFFQKAITSEAWSNNLTKFRKPLGALKSRKIRDMKEAKSLPGAPDGKYWVIQFDASFAGKAEAVETVTFMLEKYGSWKAAGYFIR